MKKKKAKQFTEIFIFLKSVFIRKYLIFHNLFSEEIWEYFNKKPINFPFAKISKHFEDSFLKRIFPPKEEVQGRVSKETKSMVKNFGRKFYFC